MPKKWDFLKPGPVPDAGVSVLRRTRSNNTKDTTVYDIEYTCCGKQGTMTHSHIERRARAARNGGNPTCNACKNAQVNVARAKQATRTPAAQGVGQGWSRDYPVIEIAMPMWPAPKTDLGPGWVPWAGRAPGYFNFWRGAS